MAQLTARWLPILEDPGSNPVTDNFDEQLFAVKLLKTKIKKQSPEMAQFTIKLPVNV